MLRQRATNDPRGSISQINVDADSLIQPQVDMEQSIKMLCDTHKAPAAFFSEKENRYVCFKCLVASEQLLYIDSSYEKDMEDFEKIKKLTAEAI